MSNTKHTPGPWNLNGLDVIKRDSETTYYRIATIAQRGTEVTPSEKQANAELIASAPSLLKENEELKAKVNKTTLAYSDIKQVNAELLEALKEAESTIEMLMGEELNPSASMSLSKIKKAISSSKS